MYFWRTDIVMVHREKRLQLALLHIDLLPQRSALYDSEYKVWSTADTSAREQASPAIGQCYNIIQDDELLRWHLKNVHALDSAMYELPNDMCIQNAMEGTF